MVKTVLGVILLLVILLLGYATTRPDHFSVQRSIVIKASPDKVFPYLNDFQKFGVWSPWEKIDPAMERKFSGAPAGVGAVYEWSGNSDVGAGRMEITQIAPNAKVDIKLDFLKPFEAHNTTEYTLQAVPEGTSVTWSMAGPSPFITKLMGVFFSMDAMIGKDFEKGLANLKAAAEKG